MSLDFASLPKPTLDELSPDLLAELPPYLVLAGTEPARLLISGCGLTSKVCIRLSRVLLDPGGDLRR